MNLLVELRPHVGEQVVEGLGLVNVEFEQWRIFITGPDYEKATGRKELEAGLVHKQAVVTCPRTRMVFHTPINFFPAVHQWPESIVSVLAKMVQAGLAAVENPDPVDVELLEHDETRPVSLPPDPQTVAAAARAASQQTDENL